MTVSLLVYVALAAAPDAGVVPSLQLAGDLVSPGVLSVPELSALGSVTTEWADKSGKHTVTGVRLDRVLLARGFGEGPSGPKVDPKVKHRGLRAIVIARASDGFEAVFSVGELLETLGSTTALVVWEMDGKPLPASLGPFRLTVLTDKGLSRSLHQLVAVRVLDVAAR